MKAFELHTSTANRKPYRTKAQKKLAKERATKREDGAWRCDVPVSYHKRELEDDKR